MDSSIDAGAGGRGVWGGVCAGVEAAVDVVVDGTTEDEEGVAGVDAAPRTLSLSLFEEAVVVVPVSALEEDKVGDDGEEAKRRAGGMHCWPWGWVVPTPGPPGWTKPG